MNWRGSDDRRRQERFTVGERPSIAVEVKSGSVDVRAGAPGEIAVSMEGAEVDQWLVEQLGDEVTIESGAGRSRRIRPVRLVVVVPPDTEVAVRVASADVTVDGRIGPTRVRSASGDVRLGDVARADVSTASGDVRAGDVRASIDCKTASGDVHVLGVGGRLTVGTASGDVLVTRAADDVSIGTASGDVRIDRYDGSNVAVKCISGDVLIGLPAGIRVEPDISTLSGRTVLPEPSSTAPTGERRVVRVGLKTVTGDIRIERR